MKIAPQRSVSLLRVLHVPPSHSLTLLPSFASVRPSVRPTVRPVAPFADYSIPCAYIYCCVAAAAVFA